MENIISVIDNEVTIQPNEIKTNLLTFINQKKSELRDAESLINFGISKRDAILATLDDLTSKIPE